MKTGLDIVQVWVTRRTIPDYIGGIRTASCPTDPDNLLAPPRMVLSGPSQAEPAPMYNTGAWHVLEEEQLAAAALEHGQDSPTKLAEFVPTRSARKIKIRLTTTASRQSVEELRDQRTALTVPGSSESLSASGTLAQTSPLTAVHAGIPRDSSGSYEPMR
jgi:hypothetical protein